MASNITTLVEKAKQGDADAFSTLYQMNSSPIKLGQNKPKQTLNQIV